MSDLLKRYSVLIVEDDEIALMYIARMLKRYFGTVITASDGAEAIEKAFRYPIDLILTDMCMPHCDGAGFIRKIREYHDDVPVIVMSAYTDTQTLLSVMSLSLTDYIIKPIHIETLLERCEETLVKRETRDTPCMIERIYGFENGITVNLDKNTVFNQSGLIELTKKEMELLTLFLLNNDLILTKNEIEYALWDGNLVAESAVKTLVKKLRSKIGEESVMTIKNIGYKISLAID